MFGRKDLNLEKIKPMDKATWAGAVDTPQAKAGLEFYKKLVDTSGTKAPKDWPAEPVKVMSMVPSGRPSPR